MGQEGRYLANGVYLRGALEVALLFSYRGSIMNNTGYSRDPTTVWPDCIRLWVIGLCKVYAWQRFDAHDREKKLRKQ